MKRDVCVVATRHSFGVKVRALCWASVFAILLMPGFAYPLGARVQRVVDGRTIVLSNGERVRYIGLEIPNDLQSINQATNVNRDLVVGADVRLEFDRQLRDKDGNLLAYVYVGELMVNEYLIQTGYARVEPYSLNRRFLTRMLRLQARASRERLGIWSRVAGEVTPVPEVEEELKLGEEQRQIESEEMPALWEPDASPVAPEVEEAEPSPVTSEGGAAVIEGE